jgi:hypothetical protein
LGGHVIAEELLYSETVKLALVLADEMTKRRITRIKVGEVEIEMSPDAWKEEIAPAEPPPQATPAVTVKEMLVGVQGELCACGHDLDTEHTDAGCLHGCADELCSPRDDAEPES